jgi:spermidine/putrescine transport system substrate-binding protein
MISLRRVVTAGLILSFGFLAQAETLSVLSKEGQISPTLIEAFEQESGVEIVPTFFESHSHRDAILAANQGRGFDLLLVDGISVHHAVKLGWIAPIDRRLVPNARHISTIWSQAFTDTADYGVPYAWGILVIAYRTDLVTAPVSSWRKLFQPQAALKGKITLIRDADSVIGMALKALGHSVNSSDPVQLTEVESMLKTQKSFVHSYRYRGAVEDSDLVRGRTATAMMYNGDALLLQERCPNITLAHPEEGTRLWCDYFAVALSSPRHDLAHAFINFLHEPERAAQNALAVRLATPNVAATQHLPEAFLSNRSIYPDGKLMARCEVLGRVEAAGLRERNRIFRPLVGEGRGT